MVSKKIIIKNLSGLHLRPASYFVNTTEKLTSDVSIAVGGQSCVNGKSILSIMGAGIKYGMEIEVRCEGETEDADLALILKAIDDGLGE